MRNQLGQSMTEFLVVMPVMLLLILGAIQFILIYQTKTTLNYATFEAVRAGTLENASRTSIEHGLTRGLAPLFARFPTTVEQAGTSDGYNALAVKVKAAREFARDEITNGYVKIELLHPTSEMFDKFPDNTIPNDHLGFRENINGVSVQDANLLKIRISYCMKLIVPLVNSLIADKGDDKFNLNCGDAGEQRLNIVSTATMRMQSPAIKCKVDPCFD